MGAFSGLLAGGDTLGLSGDLGAGKTTLVRLLAGALGVNGNVSSPTFTLAHRYDWPSNSTNEEASKLAGEFRSLPSAARVPTSSGRYLHHVDAYRLSGPEEADDLDLPDLLDGRSILVAEWAEKLRLPEDRLDIRLAFVDDSPSSGAHLPGARRLIFEARGSWRERPLSEVLSGWLC